MALREACFGYFKLGGRCVSTPVGLLAGYIYNLPFLFCFLFFLFLLFLFLVVDFYFFCNVVFRQIPAPLVLIGHFFAVAIYGTFVILTSEPIYCLPKNIYKSILVIATACRIIFPLIISELRI